MRSTALDRTNTISRSNVEPSNSTIRRLFVSDSLPIYSRAFVFGCCPFHRIRLRHPILNPKLSVWLWVGVVCSASDVFLVRHVWVYTECRRHSGEWIPHSRINFERRDETERERKRTGERRKKQSLHSATHRQWAHRVDIGWFSSFISFCSPSLCHIRFYPLWIEYNSDDPHSQSRTHNSTQCRECTLSFTHCRVRFVRFDVENVLCEYPMWTSLIVVARLLVLLLLLLSLPSQSFSYVVSSCMWCGVCVCINSIFELLMGMRVLLHVCIHTDQPSHSTLYSFGLYAVDCHRIQYYTNERTNEMKTYTTFFIGRWWWFVGIRGERQRESARLRAKDYVDIIPS